MADYDPQRNRRRVAPSDDDPAPVEAILEPELSTAQADVSPVVTPAEPSPMAEPAVADSHARPVVEDDQSTGAPRPLPMAPLGEDALPLARLGAIGAAVAGVAVVTAWRQWRRRRRRG